MNQHAEVKYEKNGKWIDKSYNYADLQAIWEGIRKPLCDNNLIITHSVSTESDIAKTEDGSVYPYVQVNVSTYVVHVNGQKLSVKMTWNVSDGKIHTLGSMITYLKRYGISAILGIVTEEDDDGGKANDQDAKKTPAKAAEPAKKAQKPAKPAATTNGSAVKPEPTDQQQVAAGLIVKAQIKALQDLRDKHKIDNAHWKMWLNTYYHIISAWKITIKDYPAIEYVLVNEPDTVKSIPLSDDVTQ
jgi:hypothetical protein